MAYYNTELRSLNVGSNYSNSSNAGLFYWNGNNEPSNSNGNIGEHAVLTLLFIAHNIAI